MTMTGYILLATGLDRRLDLGRKRDRYAELPGSSVVERPRLRGTKVLSWCRLSGGLCGLGPARVGFNKAAVALANKLPRRAYLARGVHRGSVGCSSAKRCFCPTEMHRDCFPRAKQQGVSSHG